MMKKLFVLSFFALLPLLCLAPADYSDVIYRVEAINPFLKVIDAVSSVESSHDTLAFNPTEFAVGHLQIRPVRLNDYNKKTGKNYRITDCYRPSVANEIYLYYISQFGPNKIEDAIRAWNGSGKATYDYLKKVKFHLNQTL